MMKKGALLGGWLALLGCSLLGLPAQASTDETARLQLQQRLASLQSLQAAFTQQVTDVNGDVVQQLQGQLALQRPNLLYWQTDAPDETVMVADGEQLWYYNPFVEQVSIYSQQDSLAQTPLLLLVDTDAALWQDYEVAQQEALFTLQPRADSSARQSLQLVFGNAAEDASLQRIILDDGQGQLSTINLQQVQLNQPIAAAIFSFTVPAGVTVDDQRP